MNQQTNQEATALLVIDVQKGLFEKSVPIHNAKQFLVNIHTLIAKARREGAPVLFVQHSSPKTLEKGSDAWQLHPDIQPVSGEVIIHKLHSNAFEGTNLRDELEKRNISNLVMTGLVTHGCVKATCLGALDEGYKIVLVSDGHSSYSKDAAQLIEKLNHEMGEKGAGIVETVKVDFAWHY